MKIKFLFTLVISIFILNINGCETNNSFKKKEETIKCLIKNKKYQDGTTFLSIIQTKLQNSYYNLSCFDIEDINFDVLNYMSHEKWDVIRRIPANKIYIYQNIPNSGSLVEGCTGFGESIFFIEDLQGIDNQRVSYDILVVYNGPYTYNTKWGTLRTVHSFKLLFKDKEKTADTIYLLKNYHNKKLKREVISPLLKSLEDPTTLPEKGSIN